MDNDYFSYNKPIDNDRYDKISDMLINMGAVQIKFNVKFNRPDKNGNPIPYHKEVEYGPSYNRRFNISRSFEPYISFEHTKPEVAKFGREVVRIGYHDMIAMRMLIKKVYSWIYGDSHIYATKKDDLVIIKHAREEYKRGDTWLLAFEPTVVADMNGMKNPGIRLYIVNNLNYVDMSMQNLNSLRYILEEMNLYESAQLMLNYMQRPPLGTNVYKIDSSDVPGSLDEIPEKDIEVKKGRQIPSKRKTMSFFDKMEEM